MKRRRWLSLLARPRVALLLALLEVGVLAAENTLRFPLSVPYLREVTGGHAYLDMCAFCSAERIQLEVSSLGERGRLLQALLLGSVDVLIPVLSCLFGIAALQWATRPLSGRWRPLALGLPVLALLLDAAENAAISVLLLGSPGPSSGVSAAVGPLSGLKFVAYGAVLLAIVTLGALRLTGFARPAVTGTAGEPP